MTTNKSDGCRNLIFADDLSESELHSLFSRSKKLKKQFQSEKILPQSLAGTQVALIFQEASTRTRVSFQNAVQRMGGQTLLIEAGPSSSLSKGESLEDTFLTLQANSPDLFVIRCGQNEALDHVAQLSAVPVVNGGFGHKAHPTQAFLDTFTLMESGTELKNLHCLFVGDLRHSRVFSSHRRLGQILGLKIGVCAPEEFLPTDLAGLEVFEDLDTAIPWAQAYCGLRIQFERHGDLGAAALETLKLKYTLNSKRLENLNTSAKILHPGPVNWGLEFQPEVREDSRLLLWKQMENGFFIRAALMEFLRNGAWG